MSLTKTNYFGICIEHIIEVNYSGNVTSRAVSSNGPSEVSLVRQNDFDFFVSTEVSILNVDCYLQKNQKFNFCLNVARERDYLC